MRLSCCLLVKDEIETLTDCLNSVRAVVDEMIVLDTGSTDDTPDLARSLGAQVYSFEWCNDFAVARNVSLSYATGDWILVLDADERLNSAIAPQLRAVIEPENHLVVNLIRQEIGAIQSPFSLVSRLFRKHPALQFSRPYHAMVDDSVAALLQREPHWQIVSLPEVAIFHHGYAPGAIAERHKYDKARLTMERFLVTHPGDPYVCSKLGALYVEIGRIQHGVELLERGLKSVSLDPSVQYELHYHLGIAYARQGQIPQAAQHYQQAIAQPILPLLKLGAYINLGNLRQGAGDWSGAQVLYEQAIAIAPQVASAHYNLGMVLKAQGQLPQALEQYQRAIALNPAYAQAYQNLGVVLLKLGRVGEGLDAFRTAIDLYKQHNAQEAERLLQGLESMGFQV
jgi:tetratricopeptide (TPR) repeat protein